ncbi:MAG: hypothetical protein GC152_13935 [Alphaproteobacteria bacterium]|nr:hypothetical protein [Alphaproteobacteria bacterium]
MQVSSFPDVRKFSALRERGAELKREVSNAFRELTTGRLTTEDSIRNLNGKIGDAHLMRRELDKVEIRKGSFSFALTRASIVQNSLDLVVSSIGSLPEEIRSAIGRQDQKSLEISEQTARSALDQVVSALNVRHGSRYLFSGDGVDAAPIASAETIINSVRTASASATTAADLNVALDALFGPGGEFESTLYRGGSGELPPVEIAEGDRVSLSTKADDQSVRDVIRGLVTAIVTDDLGLAVSERDEVLRGSGDLMVKGIDGVSRNIASIGLAEQRLDTARMRLIAEESVLNDAYNAMTGRDPFDAASRAQELEALLQTTYTVTARLAALSFNNFIR